MIDLNLQECLNKQKIHFCDIEIKNWKRESDQIEDRNHH